MRYSLLVVIVMAVITRPCTVRSDDWPEFRGPGGQGHAKGTFPIHWGPNQNIVWKQDIPGKGNSSPIVYGERVYLTSGVAANGDDSANPPQADLSLRALCLDAKTGKILWNTEALWKPRGHVPYVNYYKGNANPTPVVDGKHVYVHFGHLGTACLDLDGKVVWRNTDLRYNSVYGNGGSPILVDDLLVFNMDGRGRKWVVALEQATGKVKWKTDRKTAGPGKISGGFSFSTPLLIEVNGQRQIVSVVADLVASYDPKTGKEIWRVRSEGIAVVARPVFGNGMVFFANASGHIVMAIRPDGKEDVTDTHVVWAMKKCTPPETPSPVLNDNELYMVSDNGIASCLDAKTGKVHWSKRLGGEFLASPLLANGKIYFQSSEGICFVVKADTKYELIAKNRMSEETLASYAAVDGAIFLRTAEHLYKIENLSP